jgi:hypothetical protein
MRDAVEGVRARRLVCMWVLGYDHWRLRGKNHGRPTKPPPLNWIESQDWGKGDGSATHITLSGCIDPFLVHVQIRLEGMDDVLREFNLRGSINALYSRVIPYIINTRLVSSSY